MNNLDSNYQIDVKLASGKTIELAIETNLAIGSDPQLIGHIPSSSLAPKHGVFRIKNGVLSFRFLGGNKQTRIDGQVLNHGKMYIMEEGDTINIDQVAITVIKEQQQIEDDYLDQETKPDYDNSGVFNLDGTMMHKSLDEMGSDDTLMKIQLDLDPVSRSGTKKDAPLQVQKLNQSNTTIKSELKSIFKGDDTIRDKAKTVIFSLRDLMQRKAQEKQVSEVDPDSDHQQKSVDLTEIPPPPIKAYEPPPIPTQKQNVSGDLAFKPKYLLFIYALLLNGLIFYLLVTWVSIYFPVLELLNGQLATLLGPLITSTIVIPHQILGVETTFLVALYLIYYCWELLCVIIWRRSLGYLLLGMNIISPLSKLRKKATIRTLLAPFTTPLIIFDLPLLWGRRSAKDLLATIKGVDLPSKVRGWGGAVILAPIVTLILLIAPLLITSFTQESIVVTNESIAGKRLNSDGQRNQLPSTLYQFTLKGATEKFKMFPNLSLINTPHRKGSYLKIKMDIYHGLNQTPITLLPPKKISLRELLQTLLTGNPLFPYLFPHTTYLLKRPTPKGGLPPAVIKELTTLAPMLISFAPEKLQETLLKIGPITSPLLKANRQFRQQLKIGQMESLTIMKGRSRTTILKITLKSSGNGQELILIPLTSLNAPYYRLTYPTTAASTVEHLQAKIIGYSQFVLPRPTNTLTNSNGGIYNPFIITDLLERLKRDLTARQNFSLDTLPYFARWVKSAQEGPSRKFRQRTLQTLNTTAKYLAILNKKGAYPTMEQYQGELQRMSKSLATGQ
ncbi:MAG: hypothetical protein HN353_11575 [Bdellovibrionales bacterium]|jgi:hypothetical protein|nr:hypothetical protein [Bdellovibrionales bacterium]MBT3526788.1 hypothetical protein [Bdellovibrionales bacterium]MBT7766913.1 hypothetical protein [Bdellovibrionales bacterium]